MFNQLFLLLMSSSHLHLCLLLIFLPLSSHCDWCYPVDRCFRHRGWIVSTVVAYGDNFTSRWRDAWRVLGGNVWTFSINSQSIKTIICVAKGCKYMTLGKMSVATSYPCGGKDTPAQHIEGHTPRIHRCCRRQDWSSPGAAHFFDEGARWWVLKPGWTAMLAILIDCQPIVPLIEFCRFSSTDM